ncbi:AMIN-like domain-containing (lipo)protein [Klenkia brasiliensis]|uniref:AMIN-like domain-containing protein n=1 Tax=Klenkia brasiliensis TaxID=333142 RepID=A0A1G7QM43_9ACTN|nr:hypothetical protein [Klenkia brasiliensis]SDF99564.1 hypothetical protein SAMN05660324_1536 [Klenkia brasiliensis]
MRSAARHLAAVPLSALVLLAGCGGGGTDEASSTASATAGASTSSSASGTSAAPATSTGPTAGAEPGASAAPAFPADTAADTGEAVAGEGPTVVTGIRVQQQEGYTRTVFDLSGTATPGWDVAYTGTPTQEGSGSPLEVPPGSYLRVSLTGITNPYEAPDVQEATVGYVATATDPVQGVYYDSVFEGQALAYVGLTAERPFRVFALSNPTRVVVDVQQ